MKKIQIPIERIKRIAQNHKLLYVILVFAILNATLRISDSGMTSVYRLLSPFAFVAISYFFRSWFKKELKWGIVAVVYGITVSLVFYQHVSFDMWVFLGYLFVLYILVMVLYHTTDDFTHVFFRFLNAVTIVSLVLCWIQFFIRVPYPFLRLPRDPGVNVFMSNENEIAAPLACMMIIYLYLTFFKKKWVYSILVANIAFFLYINDAKMSMLGVSLGIGVYCAYGVYALLRKKYDFSPRKLFLSLCGVVVLAVVLFFVINPKVKFRDYSMSMRDLVLKGILDIIMLRPTYGSGGSMVDRTNAIIFGMMELKNSAFFGIGWGNSIQMLARPEYQLMTAKSMHNIIFQFLAEYGFFAMFCYYKIGAWLVKRIKRIETQPVNIMKVAFAAAFILISSQSSVGILSNYYTWLVVFYIALSFKRSGNAAIPANGVAPEAAEAEPE